MNKTLPIVAIVGEPNVGKSTLLNKISGTQLAVTSSVAGTTRDRQYINTAWNGVDFTLVDTAGITYGSQSTLEAKLNEQIDIALQQADLLLFVVDAKAGAQTMDRKALQKFRKSKLPAVVVVNKTDSPKEFETSIIPFQAMGIKPLFPVSSISGRGIGDLLDYITKYIVDNDLDKKADDLPGGIGVSLVGKPNVGKSSIFNKIIREDRVIVSDVPGTTRTAIDTHLKFDGQDYTFIDTAGLKRKEFRQEQPDVFSGFQTFKSIRRSDVCFLVVSAVEEITKQDQHIAQEIFNLDKGLIILANKFDLFEGDEEKLRDHISHHFPFLWMCPVFFVSGLTGQGVEEALGAVRPIYEARQKETSQEELNKLLAKKMKQNPPKLMRDQKVPKVFGLKQLAVNPPLFELYVNHPAAISTQFKKAVQNAIIKDLGYWGTPVNLRLRGKDMK
jgi:GTP-binding protein